MQGAACNRMQQDHNQQRKNAPHASNEGHTSTYSLCQHAEGHSATGELWHTYVTHMQAHTS
jgi:hypothetical protein